MATWTVEQKHEVWYQTVVEAETIEEAIKIADESSDWNIQQATAEFTDDYWAMNEDTGENYVSINGAMVKEA
jgi:hypothetical protein